MDLNVILFSSFVPLFGLIVLLLFLRTNDVLDKTVRFAFYLLLVLEATEVIAYTLELWTASWTEPSTARVIFSSICYSIQPFLVCIIINIHNRSAKLFWKRALYIPATIAAVVSLSALFLPLTFFYDAENTFQSGPLSSMSFVVSFFYLAVFFISIIKNCRKGNRLESTMLSMLLAFLVSSLLLDGFLQIRSLGHTATLFCTLSYYMYLQTQHYRTSMVAVKKAAQEQSSIDSSTGLLNRKGFLERAQAALASGDQKNRALIFLDIDDFKAVNDQMGHLIGDKVLKILSNKAQGAFREQDILGRYGGDEFYALIEAPSLETLKARLALLKEEMKCLIPNDDGGLKVSVSIGAAYFEAGQEPTLLELIDLADQALYEIKDAGKDDYYIRIFKPSPSAEE